MPKQVMPAPTPKRLFTRRGEVVISPRLTTKEICDYFRVTERTLQNWRYHGVVPFQRINARVLRVRPT